MSSVVDRMCTKSQILSSAKKKTERCGIVSEQVAIQSRTVGLSECWAGSKVVDVTLSGGNRIDQ